MTGKSKPDRKGAVKAAAIELFAGRGFQATSTAEVAKRAGVSEGIIFYHFQTKEGILVSLFEEIMEELLGDLRMVLSQAGSGWKALTGCLDLMERLTRRRSQEVLILVRDMPVGLLDEYSPFRSRIMDPLNGLIGILTRAIGMGQADGTIRDCDPEKYSVLVLGILTGVNRMRLMKVPPVPEVGSELREFCKRALAAEPLA